MLCAFSACRVELRIGLRLCIEVCLAGSTVFCVGGLGSVEVEFAGEDAHVFVAAAGEVDEEDVGRRQGGGEADGFGHCVRTLQRRQDAFGAGKVTVAARASASVAEV